MLWSMLEEKLRNEIAPPSNGLSDDIYGLQFGSILSEKNIKTVVLCLDVSKEIIIEANKRNAQLIISHHGLTHSPFKYINDQLLDRIKLLSNYNISLWVMHTAWDAAPGGISEMYARMAGMQVVDNFYFNDRGSKKPIGRIGVPLSKEIDNSKVSFESIIKNLSKNLKLKNVKYYGDLQDNVERAAICAGKGLNSEKIIDAIKEGCDTYIAGEINYPEYLLARELNLKLIETTHYSSEKIGMESLQKILTTTFPRDEFIFIESFDPAKIYSSE
jgi:GTP cyclohydrolase I